MRTSLILVAVSLLLLAAFFVVTEEEACYGYRGKALTIPLYSRSVEDTFKIVVYLPKGYNEKANKKYPVIYQLDGNNQGKLTAILAARFKCEGKIAAEPIVVAVGYYYKGWETKKTRDYTYPAKPSGTTWAHDGAGGGLRFHAFLTEELIPFIDDRFKTDNTEYGRTLIGHSLGGYYSLFVFFHQGLTTGKASPPVFKNFIAASPTIYYDWEYLTDMETKLLIANPKSLPVRLFLSMSDIEERTVVSYFRIFCMRFNKRTYPGFRFKSRSLRGLPYDKAMIPGYIEGLKFVFN